MNIMLYLTPNYLEKICNLLSMPQDVTNVLIPLSWKYDFSHVASSYAPLLFNATTGEEGHRKITNILKDESHMGFLWLIIYLAGTGFVHERYQELGIPDEIFIDTMYQFTSYVLEYQERFGYYDFDRYYWAYRQLSQTIYRIGLLEFEHKYATDPVIRNGRIIIPNGEMYL